MANEVENSISAFTAQVGKRIASLINLLGMYACLKKGVSLEDGLKLLGIQELRGAGDVVTVRYVSIEDNKVVFPVLRWSVFPSVNVLPTVCLEARFYNEDDEEVRLDTILAALEDAGLKVEQEDERIH